MDDDQWRQVEREAAEIQAHARWLTITPRRDEGGRARVEVKLTGVFEADPNDLSGSIVREIHRRLQEFEANLE
ncbi:MAG TPA: hypothetical protein VJ783_30420 [Pirellulales bacterium]|nr:hypothetical protein [Pirellulales bacterium]